MKFVNFWLMGEIYGIETALSYHNNKEEENVLQLGKIAFVSKVLTNVK